MSSPRILYVSPWPLGAPKSASELRALHVAKALQQLGDVEVVAIGQAEQEGDRGGGEAACHIAYRLGTEIHANGSWSRKVRWLLDPRLPQPHGMAVDERSARLIRSTAREFDLIWFFGLRTANVFPDWVWPRSVVDIDDVPSMFERSVLSSGISAPARVRGLMRLWSWRRRERLLGERFSVLTVCSEADRRYLTQLGAAAPVRVVPNGFERPATMPARRLASPPRLGFIGVFDHAPNAAGVDWFVRHCWPLVKREVPDARLRLVGRYTDGPLKPTGPDIEALGYVTDANGEMSTWAATVVPVRTGAGTRGKIVHAFSQRCPVVSTPLGAYGYDPTHEHDMLLGDSVRDFAEACVRVIRHPQAAAEMAERAWERFLAKWTWDAIRPEVWAAAEECLQSSAGAKARVEKAPRPQGAACRPSDVV
jgi:polysaccharide biosynthesis protein PslH